MKNKIFMYLFIFSVLLILFQYMNSKHVFEAKNIEMDKHINKIEKYKDSLAKVNDEAFELSYFNLNTSDDAMVFFENQGYDINELISFIKDELFNLNQIEGEEHPIIPYASMTDSKILIDNARLLNHKWIIASFSDSKYGGEMLIAYDIIDKRELKFNLIDSFLYPIN